LKLLLITTVLFVNQLITLKKLRRTSAISFEKHQKGTWLK